MCVEARLEKCDFSISAGRFGRALPFESNRLPKISTLRQHFSTIAFSVSDISGEVRCLTPCSPGARRPLDINGQTGFARSGATIVRRRLAHRSEH
jgi:hypothetical protein